MKFTPKLVVRLALFAAISIILGKFLSFKLEPWGRISFENLTVILAGYAYGILPGAVCGIVADILGCFCYGYSINPIITIGAAAVGAGAGAFGKCGMLKTQRLWPSVLLAHAVGSVLIKSIGIYVFYSTPLDVLILRVPIYMITGALEYALLRIILSNRGIKELMQ